MTYIQAHLGCIQFVQKLQAHDTIGIKGIPQTLD